MFNSLAAACLIGTAIAGPTMIESKALHYSDESNKDYNVVVT